jgi:hypothetical protein
MSRKLKFEIVMARIDKFDTPFRLGKPLYFEAEASWRTVLMKVEVARV